MKRLRCWFVSTVFLLSTLWGTFTFAQTDLLNLAAYPEGAPVPYGENVVVAVDENTGEKWLTNTPGQSNTSLNIPVNLTGTSEIFLKNIGNLVIYFIADDENFIRLHAQNTWFKLETISNALTTSSDSISSSNLLEPKLSLSKYIAKLYDTEGNVIINVTLPEPLTYTRIEIAGIRGENRLYELTVKNDGISPTPVKPTCKEVSDRFEEGKQAGIQQCVSNLASCGIADPNVVSVENGCMTLYTIDGQLKIPCLLVPDLFGNQTIYQVDMQQQLPAFVFDVDLESVKPR